MNADAQMRRGWQTGASQSATIGAATTPSIAPPVLRDYQSAAIAALNAGYLRGLRRMALSLPTGTGKTVIFCDVLRRRPGRGLVLVHREELIQQAVDKLHAIAPHLTVGIVKAGRNEVSAYVVVASVQTVSRPRRLEQLTAAGGFATVVVDEAHHAAADTYRRVLDAVVGPETLLIGVSATLKRGDGVRLDDVFEEVVYQRTIVDMIEAGYLSDIRGIQVRLAADFDQLHTRAGDFIDSEVEQVLSDADAPAVAVLAYQRHAAGRRTVVFAPTIRAARSFADAFNDAGIPAALVHGETPTDERRATLAAFQRGDVQVIANVGVLTEGYDHPRVDCILIARPTKSQPLYVQCIGRGTRLHPDKRDLLVLDLVGATRRHDLITVADLFGVEPQEIEHRTVTAALAAQREEEERAVVEAARIVAREVDLLRPDPFRRDAPWRLLPASEKQVNTLVRHGLFRPGITRGEASDLIAAKVAGPAVRR